MLFWKTHLTSDHSTDFRDGWLKLRKPGDIATHLGSQITKKKLEMRGKA